MNSIHSLTYKMPSLLQSQNTGLFSAPQQLLDNPSTKNNQVFFKVGGLVNVLVSGPVSQEAFEVAWVKAVACGCFQAIATHGTAEPRPVSYSVGPSYRPQSSLHKICFHFFHLVVSNHLIWDQAGGVLCSFLPFFITEHVFVYKHECFGFFVAMRG